MSPGLPALRAVGLRRTFPHPGGDVEVLRGLALEVAAGELVTVSGRSGSGKSSLLAVLCGFDAPDAGSVLLNGEPVISGALADAPPWRICAVLPQALGLATELTVAENVALPLRLRGNGEPGIDNTVATLLGELGVADLADRYPAETSFGQQQRVALARAVSARPSVLLTDEPTAHLDPASRPLVLRMLRRCATEGSAVIVATHDDEVHRIADRRIVMASGTLEEDAW